MRGGETLSESFGVSQKQGRRIAMDNSMVNTGVNDYVEATVALDDDNDQKMELARRTLVGKFASPKVLNRGAVKHIVAKAWGEPVGLEITDLGPNIFMFLFAEKQDTVEVIKKGPWYVMNYLLNLQRWIPEAAIFEINFDWVPFWVQIHGLPFGSLTTTNASKILHQIGEVMEIEDPMVEGCLLRSFIRGWVKVNVTKPLLTGCWIPRKDLPNAWVAFRYEKLQSLCFKCGIIGHEQKDCNKDKIMAVINKNLPRFGAYVGAPPAKPLLTIMSEKWKWKQNHQRPEKEGRNSSAADLHNQEAWFRKTMEEVQEKEDTEEVTSRPVKQPMSGKQTVQGKMSTKGVGCSFQEKETFPNQDNSEVSIGSADQFHPGRLQRGKTPEYPSPIPTNFRLQQVPDLSCSGFRTSPILTGHEDVSLNPPQIPRKMCYAEAVEPTDLMLDERAEREKQKGKNKIEDTANVEGDLYGVGAHMIFSSDHYLHPLQSSGIIDTRDKEKEGRKPVWWAQEQIDNAIAYGKLQIDMQALTEEIRAYWEDRKTTAQKEDMAQEEIQRNEWVQCFGPDKLWNPIEYRSISLTQEEVEKCRRQCEKLGQSESGNIAMGQGDTLEKKEQCYKVDFPSDDENDSRVSHHILGAEEEQSLVVSIVNTLSLKRQRQEEGTVEQEEESANGSSTKRARLCWTNEREDMETDISYQKLQTEEAGQAMPPTQP